MLRNKDTKILSEINVFLSEQEMAVSKLVEVFRFLKLDKLTLITQEAEQTEYLKSNLLLALLLFPIFGIKTVHSYIDSKLQLFFEASKNTIYRFKNMQQINWRRIVSNINRSIFKYIENQTVKGEVENDKTTKCLIVDDSDLEKTGYKTEGVGKIWSHVKSKSVLGFKGLFLGYWNGTSFFGLDFSLHREKGGNKKNLYGLTSKQRKEQYSKDRETNSYGFKRKKEMNQSKIKNMFQMLRRAYKRKLEVDYILVDSWFACHELIEFVKIRASELVAMFKMGNAKYDIWGEKLTAKQIVNKQKKSKKVRWRKAVNMYSTDVMADYKGNRVRLYFFKTGKRAKWHLIISTNTKLSAIEAYKIYSIRWTIEVFFKESKNYFSMGKSQSQDFDAQITDISVSIILYNIFSLLKKFNYYQTIGGIFECIKEKIQELTIWQKIWNLLIDILKTIAFAIKEDFNELIYNILKSDQNNNEFIKLLELKYSM